MSAQTTARNIWPRLTIATACCWFVALAAVAKADAGIALVGPLSGPYATTGAAIRDAAAVHSSGVSPAIIEDDRCQADTAVEVAGRIVAAKPTVVIGHPCSSAAIAAAPIYAAAQIPFISTGARHGDLTDKRAGPLVFRLSGRDDRQGRDAAAFLARASGGRAIAILHDRTFLMSTIATEATAALTGPAGQPPLHKVMPFPFVASELNYDALIAKVLAFAGSADQVGAVFFAGYPAEAVIVLKAMRAKGIDAPLLAVDVLANDDFGRVLDPGVGGMRVGAWANGRWIEPTGPLVEKVETEEKDRALGEVRVLISPDALGPRAAGDRTSAAIGIWQAANKENAANPAAALASISYEDPALGRITFDAKGDAVIPSYLVCAWRDGAWRPVAASEADKIPRP